MTTTHLAADAPGSAPAWQRGISLATCLAMVPTMASPALTLAGIDPFLSVMLGLGTTLVTLVVGGTVLARRMRSSSARADTAAARHDELSADEFRAAHVNDRLVPSVHR